MPKPVVSICSKYRCYSITSCRISAPTLRDQHCIGSNEYFDRAQTGHENHCRSAQPMSEMGQKPTPSLVPACQLRPAADKRRNAYLRTSSCTTATLGHCRNQPRRVMRSTRCRIEHNVSFGQHRTNPRMGSVLPCHNRTHAPQQTALYSITSSARPSSASGIVRPSALAVLILMSNSIFVACCTGKLAGFSPLRIRPV